MTTVDALLSGAAKQIERQAAAALLQHVLDVPYSWLIAHREARVEAAHRSTFETLVARVAAGEPLAYVIGRVAFGHLTLHVNPAVLIPRPETEELVMHALRWVKTSTARRPPARIVDVGTGSGCIALSLAQALAPATVDAVDISADALTVAQRNAAANQIDNVRWHHAAFLDPIPGPIDLLCANLPYVAPAEWLTLDDAVKYWEPRTALVAEGHGLAAINTLLKQAAGKMGSHSAIFLEIGWRQGEAVVDMARAAFPTAQVACLPDFAGLDRVVTVFIHD